MSLTVCLSGCANKPRFSSSNQDKLTTSATNGESILDTSGENPDDSLDENEQATDDDNTTTPGADDPDLDNPNQGIDTTIPSVTKDNPFGGVCNDSLPLVAQAYQLDSSIQGVPDFSTKTALLTFCSPNINIANRLFTEGFPEIPNLVEWFGVMYRGTLVVSTAGTYTFALGSDDGANLYIDNQLVVNNDGIHAFTTATGQASLTAGNHTLRVDYVQGPRDYIGVQLFWTPPGSSQEIVPTSALRRP